MMRLSKAGGRIGAWDEVRVAWMEGHISDAAYETLRAALAAAAPVGVTDEQVEEWRDRLGSAVFVSMTCTHDFDTTFCEVCWENMQAACRVFERMPRPAAAAALVDAEKTDDRDWCDGYNHAIATGAHLTASSAPAAPAAGPDLAVAWDEGYYRGVRDNESDLEPADNPYRGTPIGEG